MTAEEFLDVFFGPGNRLDRATVEARPALAEVVSRFDPALARPALLPRMADASQRVTWYALAFDDDDFRRVLEEVLGFVGPTYGRWSGSVADDAIERAVQALTGGRVARFWVDGRSESEAALEPIRRLLAVWAERPSRTGEARRSVRVMLRDIDLALAAGDGEAARALLGELRARGAVSVENARFIEVLALAAQRRWRDLVRHPDFDDVCHVKRPWRVTEALLTGAYQAWIGGAEARGDVAAAVAAYGEHAEVLDALLRTRGPLRTPAVVKAAAVRQATTHGRPTATPIVVETLDEEVDRGWVRALLGTNRPAAEERVGPSEAFEVGAYDTAMSEALASIEPSALSDIILLSAYELGTLESATQAMAFWRGLQPDEQEAARRRRVVREALEDLEELAGASDGPAPPTTWLEWFVRLHEQPQWTAAAAVAWCGALEFDALGAVDDAALSEIAEAIRQAAQTSPAVMLEGLPAFLSWLARREPPATSASTLYRATLEALALMDGWESAGLEVTAEVVVRLLDRGVSPAAYVDMLDSIDMIWARMVSRRHADWFADMVELLGFQPGDRARLLSTFVAGVEPLRGQVLPRATREGLRLTGEALGIDVALAPAAAEVDADEDEQPIPPDTVVGIYTLDPQVGARVRERLERDHAGLRVEHCYDKVATERLVNLARRANLLIVAIGSAKHAATDAIDANRPAELPTIRHAFRGSTRIVAACEQAIRDGVLAGSPAAVAL